MSIARKNNFIKGYIQIEVEGFFIERFLNTCAKEGIQLWGTKRKNKRIVITNIHIENFKKIRKAAKKTQNKVKIKKKRGIPFIIKKYKNRKVFIFLFFTLILSICALSNFIWNIEIEGNQSITTEEILNELNQNGIKQGTLKYKIDINQTIEKMRLKDSRISWIGMKIEGTNIKVSIVEAVEKPNILDENEYCDIIAKKEGIITKINVTSGTALVKEGDVIEQGEKLIGGWMEGKYTGVRYMHASGEIEAKVWYIAEMEENYIQQEKTKTNNQENKYGLIINKKPINFYKNLSKFEKYDTMETKNKIKILNNFYLPIEFKKITNYEYKYEQKEYTKEELQNNITSKLEEQMKSNIEGKEIINKNTIIEPTENGIKVKLIYEVIEKIGVEQKLVSWKEKTHWKKEV